MLRLQSHHFVRPKAAFISQDPKPQLEEPSSSAGEHMGSAPPGYKPVLRSQLGPFSDAPSSVAVKPTTLLAGMPSTTLHMPLQPCKPSQPTSATKSQRPSPTQAQAHNDLDQATTTQHSTHAAAQTSFPESNPLGRFRPLLEEPISNPMLNSGTPISSSSVSAGTPRFPTQLSTSTGSGKPHTFK